MEKGIKMLHKRSNVWKRIISEGNGGKKNPKNKVRRGKNNHLKR